MLPAASLAGDERRQRQAGERVAGQEALGGEVAVGVEVGLVAVVRLGAKQVELVLGLSAETFGLHTVGLRAVGRLLDLRLLTGLLQRRAVQRPPPVQRVAELRGNRVEGVVEPGVGPPRRLPQTGFEIGEDRLGALVGPCPRSGVVEVGLDRREHLRVVQCVVEVEHVGHRLAEIEPALGEPHGMHVRPEQVLVREFESGCLDLAGDHQLGLAEEVLIVAAARRAVGEHERRLAAPTGAARPLGVVRRGRRHVAHVDDVELRDVDTELHRRRAVQHREFRSPEPVLAVEAEVVGHLRGVLAGLDAEKILADRAVQVDEEAVGLDAFVGQVRHANVVVIRTSAVGDLPSHR